MLFKSTTAVALLAMTAHAVAEPRPYVVSNARKVMSTREMFGVIARDVSNAYAPSETLCGLGDSCSEACGSGYQTCQSGDNAIHCYNPATQVCCPDNSGNSCDAGYFCAGATDTVVCCPDGMSLSDCTKAYGLDKALTSEVAAPTTSSSAAPSSSSVATTSSSSSFSSSSSSSSFSSSSSSIASSSIAPNTTSSSIESTTTATAKAHAKNTTTSWGTAAGTTGFPTTTPPTTVVTATATNNFTSASGPSPAATTVATSAAGSIKAVGAAVALLAAGFAFLL